HHDSREVICRMAVEHDSKDAIGVLMREQGTGSISMAPGHVGMTLGVNVNEVARVFSFLIPKSAVTPNVTIDGKTHTVPVPVDGGFRADAISPAPETFEPAVAKADTTVPLLALAWVRNGDKGDISNVAVIAR